METEDNHKRTKPKTLRSFSKNAAPRTISHWLGGDRGRHQLGICCHHAPTCPGTALQYIIFKEGHYLLAWIEGAAPSQDEMDAAGRWPHREGQRIPAEPPETLLEQNITAAHICAAAIVLL